MQEQFLSFSLRATNHELVSYGIASGFVLLSLFLMLLSFIKLLAFLPLLLHESSLLLHLCLNQFVLTIVVF